MKNVQILKPQFQFHGVKILQFIFYIKVLSCDGLKIDFMLQEMRDDQSISIEMFLKT